MEQSVLFGRYRLLEPAGTGGTAAVWRAIDERTGDEVAVKRLHPIVFADEAARARLVREFRALRGLDHPNVVRVRDLELDGNEAALILDYVPGPSLAARLAESDPMPLADAISIARDVAAGLEAAHSAGIIHRDVKPGNVLLAPDGRARLSDFGIARDGRDDTALTGAGLVVGTLRYLAPEQLRGEPATVAADVYGLGAVTWEMLAGRPLYAARTAVAVAEAQRAGPPSLDDVPRPVAAAVRRALASRPSRRFPSAAAFATALERAAPAPVGAIPSGRAGDTTSVSIPAVPTTRRTPGRSSSRPVRAGAVPAAADGTALAPSGTRGAAAAPSNGRTPMPTSRVAPASVRSRSRPAPVALAAAIAFGLLVLAAAGMTAPRSGGAAPTDRPTAVRTAAPAPTRQAREGKGEHKDRGKGKGHDKGD